MIRQFASFGMGFIIGLFLLASFAIGDEVSGQSFQRAFAEDEQPLVNLFPPESAEKAVKKLIESLRPHANPQKTCALYGIQRRGKRDKHLGRELSVALSKANIFRMVARGDEIERVWKELELTQSDFFDPKTRQRIGRNLGADLILFGAVEEGGQFAKLYLTLEEVETGTILWKDATYITKNRVGLQAGVRSAFIPGWGQFYKGQRSKGLILLGGETFFISGGFLTRTWSHDYYSKAKNARYQEDRDFYLRWSNRLSDISLAAWVIAGLTHVYNLIDAFESKERFPKKEAEQAGTFRFQIHNSAFTANYFKRF